ncbi:MAG: HupE/UreJ family protein [bacterium]|nr:HupE/UreJ family protein [bacterium]
MKILKTATFHIILILVLIFSFTPSRSSAHELIPKLLKEYVENNPNATPEEIKAFADSQSPEFSKQFKDGQEVLRVVKQQDTSLLDNMFDFFKIGVGHILSGLDHILFVLSLLLVFLSWKEILNLTLTFTVAHSITLLLAGSGLLVLSPSIIEPIIALSIAYVALSSVFLKGNKFFGGNKGKMAAVFFFGLFHGLGFAGLLQEIDIPKDKLVSSLLVFNLGIEAGQLAIVLLATPIIYYAKNKTWYPRAIKVFAIAISFIALFWFIERIIG